MRLFDILHPAPPPDSAVRHALSDAARALAPGGRVHVLGFVRPGILGRARVMARLDRGRFARSLNAWQQLVSEDFETMVHERYTVRGGLWRMRRA